MNATHFIIVNRAAISGDWIHIVPKGELPNRAAGVTQVLDDAALDSILANIAADRERLGDKWPGIYAGREHFIYNDEQDSAALAWFKDFEKRADGIWASKDGLTPIGKEVIANAEYKFTSFVADRKDTEKLAGNKVRILKLDTIGFTNQANGKELLTPMVNRETLPGSREPGANQNQNQRTNTMKSIAQKLGLAPEASEDAILGEVTKIQNRLTTLEPLAAENTTLKNRIAQVEADACESLLDGCGLKPDDKRRAHLLNSLKTLKNREERLTHLLDFDIKPVEAKEQGKGPQARVINRGDGRPAPAGADDENPREKAQRICNRAREIQQAANGKVSLESATVQASAELNK